MRRNHSSQRGRRGVVSGDVFPLFQFQLQVLDSHGQFCNDVALGSLVDLGVGRRCEVGVTLDLKARDNHYGSGAHDGGGQRLCEVAGEDPFSNKPMGSKNLAHLALASLGARAKWNEAAQFLRLCLCGGTAVASAQVRDILVLSAILAQEALRPVGKCIRTDSVTQSR